jgi:hypothetical protein
MQTLQPDAYFNYYLPYEPRSKNAPLYHYERHRKANPFPDQFSADFPANVLIFEPSQTIRTKTPRHL